jgi:hypothetical protein
VVVTAPLFRCLHTHNTYDTEQKLNFFSSSRYRNAVVDPDNIVIVPGGKVTMWNAILMFGEPGAEIMYPNPGFPIYESVIKYSGATAVPIPMLEESVSFSSIFSHSLCVVGVCIVGEVALQLNFNLYMFINLPHLNFKCIHTETPKLTSKQ